MKYRLPVRPRLLFAACLLLILGLSGTAQALGSSQTPQSTNVGLEGTITAPPPTRGATIVIPVTGRTFTTMPTTVSGLCPDGLLVKVFSNNIFVGAAECQNSSYSLQVSLFAGRNDLVARVYDSLDQAGPDSNVVSVTFNDAQFAQFGSRVSLTSSYAERGANPDQELDWPIILSGGSGPYAISTDWGDGTAPTLQSQSFPGTFTVKHTYRSSGVYKVVVRATDANGTTAFLQLVGVATGPVSQSSTTKSNNKTTSTTHWIILWWPALLLVPLIAAAFWLGRRHELYSIRKHLEQN